MNYNLNDDMYDDAYFYLSEEELKILAERSYLNDAPKAEYLEQGFTVLKEDFCGVTLEKDLVFVLIVDGEVHIDDCRL